MLNQYSLWKYLLILAVVLLGALYALPNLYGEDPALQISGLRGSTVDKAVEDRVVATLKAKDLVPKKVELSSTQLLMRFDDTETQLKAQDVVRTELGDKYVVALNLAPTTPRWLTSVGALPMYLGLDLRGGVYFLLEVDMTAAVRQADERNINDMRSLLRNERLRYQGITREGDDGILVSFRDAATRDKAHALVQKKFDDLLITDEDSGGEFRLRTKLTEKAVRDLKHFALEQNITTLRNRVNELGVAEPAIAQQGDNRIVVQLPGVQDTARAKQILGATATLEFRMVDEEHSVQDALNGRVPVGSKLYYDRQGHPILLDKRVIITGDYITDAASGIEQQTGTPAVFITLDGRGARIMEDRTKDNVGKRMAVVYIENKVETHRNEKGKPVRVKRTIEEVINVAVIRERLAKRFQISGLDSTTEARNLALLLRAGALAAPMEIVEERTVGPSLGKENIKRGFYAAVAGMAAVALFMGLYYKAFGLIAGMALLLNLVLILGVMSIFQFTLTLPGIAGIALTIGMAVDANVLIFERIREELRSGSTPQASIHAGYEKAFATIADSNITTLIGALALFTLGSGPVQGFGLTLTIGILTSMFTAIMGSRAVVNLAFGGRRLASLPI